MNKNKIMEMYLTDREIDECCIKIRDEIIITYPEYKSYAKFLYLYGCRINELFDYRISFDAINTKVEIQPQKGNNLRIMEIKNSEVPAIIEEINISQDRFYLNKRNLQRIIEKVNPYRSLYCKTKKIGAHLFRHNFIRKEILEGKQIETINQQLGYTQQTIADTYLLSEIYYKY